VTNLLLWAVQLCCQFDAKRVRLALMIKALLLVFDSGRTWDGIARAHRSTGFILFAYLMPLLLLTSAVEGWGLVHWGEHQGNVNYIRRFTLQEAVFFELAQLALTVVITFVGAWIIKSLGETFHGKHTINQCFTVVAYGLGPLFTLRLLDALPISPWIAWAFGIMLCTAVLYQGVPRIMRPDPPHAFGLYLMSALMLTIATGLARFVLTWYLQGRFKTAATALHNLGIGGA
jgi:hypothetical protein